MLEDTKHSCLDCKYADWIVKRTEERKPYPNSLAESYRTGICTFYRTHHIPVPLCRVENKAIWEINKDIPYTSCASWVKEKEEWIV